MTMVLALCDFVSLHVGVSYRLDATRQNKILQKFFSHRSTPNDYLKREFDYFGAFRLAFVVFCFRLLLARREASQMQTHYSVRCNNISLVLLVSTLANGKCI
jgi:hypothetical protein